LILICLVWITCSCITTHVLLQWHHDGDQPILEPKEAMDVQRVQGTSTDIKDVQIMVRDALTHSDSQTGNSPSSLPGFVWRVEIDPDGEISCTTHHFKA